MCVLAPLCEFVMNAITVPFRVAVSSVEGWESLMHTTAKSVHSKRRTGMVVQKLSIWGVPKRTCFTNVRNMVSRKDDDSPLIVSVARAFHLSLYTLLGDDGF